MTTRTTDFHFFLKSLSQRFQCLAVFNSEFKCLNISTPFGSNSVGLMSGLKILKNFFPWDGSQIIIFNDPLLGCSRSDRIQFMFSAETFHFCIEESFNLPWDFSQKIIKIPPIPIVENHRTNTQLLDTLTNQPDCPKEIRPFIISTLQKIEKFQEDFKALLKGNKNFTSKELQKDYLTASSEASLKTVKSKTYFSSQSEYEFESSGILKLKMSTSELGIGIDFQGTTLHPTIQLADSITDSVCFHFFADYFQFGDMMNEATYSLFQITKPTQSFVNSKFFSNKLYSDFCGIDLLKQALLNTLSEKLGVKPYLLSKSYFQFNSGAENQSLTFSIPNSKPMGSLGTTYAFEPLLSSRSTPGGQTVPDFDGFHQVGIDVLGCQPHFLTPKHKESNDFQTQIRLICLKPTRFAILQPNFPRKNRLGKSKMIVSKPTLLINGQIFEDAFNVVDIKVGDQIEIKTGSIDFSAN